MFFRKHISIIFTFFPLIFIKERYIYKKIATTLINVEIWKSLAVLKFRNSFPLEYHIHNRKEPIHYTLNDRLNKTNHAVNSAVSHHPRRIRQSPRSLFNHSIRYTRQVQISKLRNDSTKPTLLHLVCLA